MAPKRPAPKGRKLMHGYTPLIGPEAWLSTMGKMRMSLASTFVFNPLPHAQIAHPLFTFYRSGYTEYCEACCHDGMCLPW